MRSGDTKTTPGTPRISLSRLLAAAEAAAPVEAIDAVAEVLEVCEDRGAADDAGPRRDSLVHRLPPSRK